MENVIRFPPRFLIRKECVLGREIVRLVRECEAQNVNDLARIIHEAF